MSHDDHERAPGYSPEQVLWDGCGECTERAENLFLAISHMDPQTFERAWDRAALFNRGLLRDPSQAEVPLLNVLWACQVQFERRGIPIGFLPSGAST